VKEKRKRNLLLECRKFQEIQRAFPADETFFKTKFSSENQLCGPQGEDSQHMTLR
jgi:hypothetical protein